MCIITALFVVLLGLYGGLALAQSETQQFFGTTEPFASEAIYFVLTDRFVDGDPNNNHVSQGGANGTWERRLDGGSSGAAFVGYQGGDFKGIYDNANYIKNLGMTAVWISPIVDNPDQAFTGDRPVQFGSPVGTDGGKTGYHGYWGVNFYKLDEHLKSPGFSFQEFAQKMKDDHELKIVLDIVANHGSPSWSMPTDQPKFGEIYDRDDRLIADHQNREPSQLDPNNPLHQFFNRRRDLATLADLNETNPEVLDYLTGAYLQWIDQGADAFRVDTIKHMPHSFWKAFSDRIRAEHPGFFMFGEHFDSNADTIAQHQKPENGAISVLDFPGKDQIIGVFENPTSDYAQIQSYLHLDDCTYTNPYELATFYDNHDMRRMNATENGFIDAHNWLFTARGIPVLYYGSEMRFQHGRSEHSGNRNYYGPGNIAAAPNGEIYKRLAKIAKIRKGSIALQKGLQENILLQGNRAAFYRVYQNDDGNETALVLLNKGDQPAQFEIDRFVSAGTWRTDATDTETFEVAEDNRTIKTLVGAHDVKVLFFNAPVNDPDLTVALQQQMNLREACGGERVTIQPDVLVAGQKVKVFYRAEFGKEVALHWGINNWNGTGTPVGEDAMIFDEDELAHTIELTIPQGAMQFDFVFHILTDDRWDNNNGQDWHFAVQRTGVIPRSDGFKSHFPGLAPGQKPVLRLTGQAFSGLRPDNDTYVLKLVEDHKWQGTVEVENALTQTEYKLTLNGDWTVNWGAGGSGMETSLGRGGPNAQVTLARGTCTLEVTEGTSVDSPVQVRWICETKPVDSSWITQTNIYQVFVSKFGGTLKGVESHLDHLEYLGVKTIWLMPIFESMSDHGYDATDYYAIRPEYGTKDDLKDLVQAAKAKGMRIVLDLVMNHVGSDHPWFSSPDANERKDHWFVWSATDKGWNKPWGGDSGPRVTWFGDPQEHVDRDNNGNPDDDDHFYAVFSPTMPDFNFNKPTPRKELIDEFTNVMRYWIEETGVSGFRCDAARYFVENGAHSDLRKDQAETHAIWKQLRANLAAIDPEAILLAEAPTETYEQMRRYYGTGDEFHTAFHFKYQGALMDTLRNNRRPRHFLTDLYAIQAHLPQGTQDTIFLSNHDSFAGDRVASQLNGNIAEMQSVASLYLLLSGNPAIYYGEEIGMEGAGSDAELRKPMDFCEATAQKIDPNSLFNHYTRLLRLRDNYAALQGGITYFAPSLQQGWDCHDCEANRLAMIREYFGEKVLVVHNFTHENFEVRVDLSEQATGLTIPDGTPVHALMGGGNYPSVASSNRSSYPVGTLFGLTTKVLFLGDISSYQAQDSSYLTYESALGEQAVSSAVSVCFECDNGHTDSGQSVYVVGEADELGGNWNTDKAVKLDPTHYPVWTGVIALPPNSSTEWKCIIRDEESPFHVQQWGPGSNNVVNTPTSGVHFTKGRL